jgi:hypothetical protein
VKACVADTIPGILHVTYVTASTADPQRNLDLSAGVLGPRPAAYPHTNLRVGGISQPLSLVVAGYIVANVGLGVAFLAGACVFLITMFIGASSRELSTM